MKRFTSLMLVFILALISSSSHAMEERASFFAGESSAEFEDSMPAMGSPVVEFSSAQYDIEAGVLTLNLEYCEGDVQVLLDGTEIGTIDEVSWSPFSFQIEVDIAPGTHEIQLKWSTYVQGTTTINVETIESTPTPSPTPTPMPPLTIESVSYENGILSWTVSDFTDCYDVYIDGTRQVQMSKGTGRYSISLTEGTHEFTIMDGKSRRVSSTFTVVNPAATPSPTPKPEFVIVDGVLTEYNGNGGDVVIPDGVTKIGNRVFNEEDIYYHGKITGIEFSNTVTEIGREAFAGCNWLHNIDLPDNILHIGEYAFSHSGLNSISFSKNAIIGKGAFSGYAGTSLTIPGSLPVISDQAFSRCPNLTDLTICEGVKRIGQEAFSECENLTTLTLPKGLTLIDKWAFQQCGNLTRVTISEGTTYIGEEAFLDCKKLESVVIPDSVAYIRSRAFHNCSLKTVSVPAGAQVEPNAFDYDTAIVVRQKRAPTDRPTMAQSLLMPKSLTEIGAEAFVNTSAREVVILDGCTAIGARAFADSRVLTRVVIPSTVSSIAKDAFEGCANVVLVCVDNDYAVLYAIENHIKYSVP